ncbi:MAG: VWA domain-containing protein [Planctomycetota bacterium]|nr:MAG: VWA domain-containing protein [Planctomycetota bacterium]
MLAPLAASPRGNAASPARSPRLRCAPSPSPARRAEAPQRANDEEFRRSAARRTPQRAPCVVSRRQRRKPMRPFALALVAGGLLAAAPPALAQGFIIVERPVAPPVVRPRPRPLPLQRHFPLVVQKVQVRVRIDGPVATTEVLQTFRNPLPRRLEGTYMFPLPPDAALDRFSMWIDGKEMQGELLPAEKALEVYTGIVRRMQDPALLQYAGRGLFKVRIFPIEPRSTKRVKLTYRQLLTADGGRVRYRYPLDTERFSAQPLEECVISVDLRSDVPLKGISSPWHRVDLRREGDHAARASWEARDVRPDRDFVLDYDLSPDPIGISVRTHARPGEDGTFLLLVTPGAEVGRAERMAKDVVFVFDTSGSMAGEKMDQARRALRYMIQRLDPSDRFAVIDFATDARAYKDGLVPASAEERRGALAYVDELVARGGTATDEALQRAMALRSEEAGRPFSVVFLTDGQPTMARPSPSGSSRACRKSRPRRRGSSCGGSATRSTRTSSTPSPSATAATATTCCRARTSRSRCPASTTRSPSRCSPTSRCTSRASGSTTSSREISPTCSPVGSWPWSDASAARARPWFG